VRLRQFFMRIAKQAAMMAGRYEHAKQFNHHRRQLRILRIRLGRIIRDIHCKIAGQPALQRHSNGHSRRQPNPLSATAPVRLEAVFLPSPESVVNQ
jgi:hypothetical protein